jgi:hypothetical protein
MVAKKNNATGIVGVAPDASVIALKACWPDKPDALEAVATVLRWRWRLTAPLNLTLKS